MGESETFAVYIHHGGRFTTVDNQSVYAGGNLVGKFGFDVDRFGFFDLVDEVKSLGYESWDGLQYKIPKTKVYEHLKDDTDVMLMLKQLSEENRYIYVYVDRGKKVGESEQIGGCGGDVGDWGDSSEEDEDYCPSEDDLTDDSLSDLEFASDDEEYIDARKKIRHDKTPREVFERYVGADINVETHAANIEGNDTASDYDDSDCDVNSSSTEDEFESVKIRKKRTTYDPKCNHKNLDVVLGLRFENGYQARDALTNCAILNGWHLRFKRTSHHQMEAKCSPPCEWRCFGSIIKGSGVFTIRTVRGEHKCPRKMSNKLVTSVWIAKQYLNVFRVRPGMQIDDLRNDICDRFSVHVTKWRLYQARALAGELLRGTIEEHYASMRRYIAELKRVDRNGRFDIRLGEGAVFKGIYIGFTALKEGFMKGCRKIIGLDGAFLKTYLGGVLLGAIGKDGNNQMFPIAWAVVEVENQENWTWFLGILLDELGINDGNGFTFVSDQQKGLINAVANLVPYAEHRNCARHVYCNWKKQHKGATLKNMFWRACRSTYMEEYQLALEAMKQESEAAYVDFLERGPQKFCKTFISLAPTCDMIDNNVAETFNGYIVHARGKHVIDMLEEIRCSLMKRQVRLVAVVDPKIDFLCPKIRQKIEKMKVSSRHCITHPALGGKFEVHLFENKFVVDVGNKTCSCREWDITGIPCGHVVAAITFLNEDPAKFVHEYYSANKYLEAYKHGLEPLNGKQMWPAAEGSKVLPPPFKKMPGRPKKKRVRDPDERNPNDFCKLRKNGVIVNCSKCLQTGHNRRTCTNEEVEKPPKEQKKRGRPPKPNDSSSITKSTTSAKATSAKATSTAKTRKKDVGKERTLARKGIGCVSFEDSGNIYVHSSSSHGKVHFVNPRKTKATGTSSSATTELPTQESRN